MPDDRDPEVTSASVVELVPRAPTHRKFAVHLTFDLPGNITHEQLQAAIFRAVHTKAFAINGRLTINMLRLIEES